LRKRTRSTQTSSSSISRTWSTTAANRRRAKNVRTGIDRARQGGAEVFVRCDLELLYADLQAVGLAGLQGIILPKVTSVAQIREAEDILTHFESERGVPCKPDSCTR